MIEYKKSGLDEDVLRLLNKLEARFPVKSLLLDIENKLLTVNKVFYDGKLYGILVLRMVTTRLAQVELVVNHAIAEDNIEIHFSNILGNSLADHAFSHGFDSLRIHTGNDGRAKMAQRWMGEPTEFVYTITKEIWKHQVIHKQSNKQVPAQQTLA